MHMRVTNSVLWMAKMRLQCSSDSAVVEMIIICMFLAVFLKDKPITRLQVFDGSSTVAKGVNTSARKMQHVQDYLRSPLQILRL